MASSVPTRPAPRITIFPVARDGFLENVDGLINVQAVGARNGRRDRFGTNRGDDDVRLQLPGKVRRHRRLKAEINGGAADQPLMLLDIVVQAGLEGDVLFAENAAAQLAAFLAENDLVAVPGRGERSLHTGDAAADDQDLLALWCRERVINLPFAAAFGIDGAQKVTLMHAFGEAGHAAHAFPDLLRLPVAHLVRQIRVADQRARHVDDIGLPGGQNLLHIIRIAQSADRADQRFFDVFSDFGGVLDVPALGIEHADVGPGEGFLGMTQAPDGDVKDIRVAIQLFGNTAGLVHLVAAGVDLGAADADLHREALPADPVDLVDGHHGKAAAVFGASAPAVAAVIQGRRHELLQSPAVGAVERYHAEARAFRGQGGFAEAPDHLQEPLLRHGTDLQAVRQRHVHRPPGRVRPIWAPGAGIDARELQLDDRHRAVPRNHAGQARVIVILRFLDIPGPGSPRSAHPGRR